MPQIIASPKVYDVIIVGCGFLSSEMGVRDLPYLGNTAVADWQGCPPEVLAKLGLELESKGPRDKTGF